MIKIIISDAGGAASNNVVKSLRLLKDEFHLIGISSDKYLLALADVDERYLVPLGNEPEFIPILQHIIKKTNPDLIMSQNDAIVDVLSRERDKLNVKQFLPNHETVITCHNKFASYEKWNSAGLILPKTMLISNAENLKKAFTEYGNKFWIRAVEGWAARGALCVEDYNFAKAWIDYYKGWGNFTAAEYLSPQSVTWMSIWNNGELVVAQGRKRIEWRFGHHSISGITGQTGVAETISDPAVDDIAQKAIYAIDKKPHGIFSVDMTYDKNNIPNPTEINIGRFFTTNYFFASAGLNMVDVILKLAVKKESVNFPVKINPLEPGLMWIRQIDMEPKIFKKKEIEDLDSNLINIKKRLKF